MTQVIRKESRVQNPGNCNPESATWKIGREALLNLGGARAVLLQLAHPLVAIGVGEHSRYMRDPLGRAESTFLLGQLLTFGSYRTKSQAAHTINRLHKHVLGTLPHQAGAYKAGSTYNARDPELLLWVHATLIDTVLLMYPMFIGPLSHSEQEQYYQESKTVAKLLGLAEKDMPETVDDLRRYVHTMVHSNRLAATPYARQLARLVLFPPTPPLARPFLYLNFYLTCALLPQPVLGMYDLEWSPKKQLVFEASTILIRKLMAYLPPTMRVLPISRRLLHASHIQGGTRLTAL